MVRNCRITGAQLADADDEFMRDTLGEIDESWRATLRREITPMLRSCTVECAVYAWGSNKHGQLANKKALIISAPKKLDLPEHIVLDDSQKELNSIMAKTESIVIKKIFCGIKHSGILLSNGEFWACGNVSQKAN